MKKILLGLLILHSVGSTVTGDMIKPDVKQIMSMSNQQYCNYIMGRFEKIGLHNDLNENILTLDACVIKLKSKLEIIDINSLGTITTSANSHLNNISQNIDYFSQFLHDEGLSELCRFAQGTNMSISKINGKFIENKDHICLFNDNSFVSTSSLLNIGITGSSHFKYLLRSNLN